MEAFPPPQDYLPLAYLAGLSNRLQSAQQSHTMTPRPVRQESLRVDTHQDIGPSAVNKFNARRGPVARVLPNLDSVNSTECFLVSDG